MEQNRSSSMDLPQFFPSRIKTRQSPLFVSDRKTLSVKLPKQSNQKSLFKIPAESGSESSENSGLNTGSNCSRSGSKEGQRRENCRGDYDGLSVENLQISANENICLKSESEHRRQRFGKPASKLGLPKEKLVSNEFSDDYGLNKSLPTGRFLDLNFVDTWGDCHYLGITGIVVLSRDSKGKLHEVHVDVSQVQANPSSINVNGHSGDARTIDKVFDGVNETTDQLHMWLVEFSPGEDHTMQIDLGENGCQLAGLRVWNYNKSTKDTTRGARLVHIFLDGNRLSPSNGLIFFQAKGNSDKSFQQEIIFKSRVSCCVPKCLNLICNHSAKLGFCDRHSSEQIKNTASSIEGKSRRGFVSLSVRQDWRTIVHPSGSVLRLDFHGSHGDRHYIGLQKLEIFDENGVLINLEDDEHGDGAIIVDRDKSPFLSVCSSVLRGDCGWLEPLANVNHLYVRFKRERIVSMIRFWNYHRIPACGAKEVSIFFDDYLMFHGELARFSTSPQAIDGVPQCILFTNNTSVVDGGILHFSGDTEQNVTYIDDRRD